MKSKQFTPQKILDILNQAETWTGTGSPYKELGTGFAGSVWAAAKVNTLLALLDLLRKSFD